MPNEEAPAWFKKWVVEKFEPMTKKLKDINQKFDIINQKMDILLRDFRPPEKLN